MGLRRTHDPDADCHGCQGPNLKKLLSLVSLVTGCMPDAALTANRVPMMGRPSQTSPTQSTRLKMVCDRLVVCGRIFVAQSPFSDSASQPSLSGTSGESIS
jgi:hypothetical protein